MAFKILKKQKNECQRKVIDHFLTKDNRQIIYQLIKQLVKVKKMSIKDRLINNPTALVAHFKNVFLNA